MGNIPIISLGTGNFSLGTGNSGAAVLQELILGGTRVSLGLSELNFHPFCRDLEGKAPVLCGIMKSKSAFCEQELDGSALEGILALCAPQAASGPGSGWNCSPLHQHHTQQSQMWVGLDFFPPMLNPFPAFPHLHKQPDTARLSLQDVWREICSCKSK